MSMTPVTAETDDGEQLRRAYKQHRKSTRGRGHEPDKSEWTAFRACEKRFKSKFPPPSLDDVLDLTALVSDDAKMAQFNRRGTRTAVAANEVRTTPSTDRPRRAFTLPRIPGWSHLDVAHPS